MTAAPKFARLTDRALLRIGGPDWRSFLQGLVTQDVEGLGDGELRFGALLTPQGRLLYDLFLLGRGDDCLIDVAADAQGALAQRLAIYRLRAKVETLKLQDRIHFSGYLQGEALARCLNRHRTMVVPSMGPEGFGIVALEGLACGCRMIVSEAGGLPEAVAGHADTFAMGDLVALHRLLERALDEGEPSTAERGLFLDRHMRPHVASQYLGVFERVVGVRPPRAQRPPIMLAHTCDIRGVARVVQRGAGLYKAQVERRRGPVLAVLAVYPRQLPACHFRHGCLYGRRPQRGRHPRQRSGIGRRIAQHRLPFVARRLRTCRKRCRGKP